MRFLSFYFKTNALVNMCSIFKGVNYYLIIIIYLVGRPAELIATLDSLDLTLGAGPATAPHGENGASSSRQRTEKK